MSSLSFAYSFMPDERKLTKKMAAQNPGQFHIGIFPCGLLVDLLGRSSETGTTHT